MARLSDIVRGLELPEGRNCPGCGFSLRLDAEVIDQLRNLRDDLEFRRRMGLDELEAEMKAK